LAIFDLLFAEAQLVKSINSSFKAHGSHFRPVDDKLKLCSQFKVVLAMENSLYPGYVTEKLLQAHLSGAHVIYSGYPGSSGSVISLRSSHIFNFVEESMSDSVLKFVDRAFSINSAVHIPSLLQRDRLFGLIGEICAKLRKRLGCYL